MRPAACALVQVPPSACTCVRSTPLFMSSPEVQVAGRGPYTLYGSTREAAGRREKLPQGCSGAWLSYARGQATGADSMQIDWAKQPSTTRTRRCLHAATLGQTTRISHGARQNCAAAASGTEGAHTMAEGRDSLQRGACLSCPGRSTITLPRQLRAYRSRAPATPPKPPPMAAASTPAPEVGIASPSGSGAGPAAGAG